MRINVVVALFTQLQLIISSINIKPSATQADVRGGKAGWLFNSKDRDGWCDKKVSDASTLQHLLVTKFWKEGPDIINKLYSKTNLGVSPLKMIVSRVWTQDLLQFGEELRNRGANHVHANKDFEQ